MTQSTTVQIFADANSRPLFRALISTAVDGIIVIDAEGTVLVYNPACERLFGYAAGQVVGQNVKMLMPPPYHDEHDAYLRNFHETGRRRIIGIGREVVGRRADGSTFPMYLSVGEGELDGQQIFVGIIHDMTEQRATEGQLRELQSELQHVSRVSAMGQMSSAIAHELNQPLTAIVNYVKAAKRTLDQVDDERVVRAMDMIDKAVAQTLRAGAIIRNLREFVEKREGNRAPQDLNQIVEEAIALSFVGAADVNVKVNRKLAAKLPLMVVDKVQIQQVLINLVRNSVEAMLSVKKRELTVTTAMDGPAHVLLTVRDTGPGLSPEVMARLFQPFTTTKEKGMGIGLTICQSIVEAHGGHISAMKDLPKGAGFVIRLPVDGTPEEIL